MVYRGRVLNGVVVLETDVKLPDGTVVTVQTATPERVVASEDPVYRLGALAVSTGVSDLALNIDHYLYGHPKVNDAR